MPKIVIIVGKDEVGSSNLPSSSTKVLETQVSRTLSLFMGEKNRAHFCLTTDAPLLGKFMNRFRSALRVSPGIKNGRSLLHRLRPFHSFGGVDFVIMDNLRRWSRCKKGFSEYNIIVDRNKKKEVKMWNNYALVAQGMSWKKFGYQREIKIQSNVSIAEKLYSGGMVRLFGS